jgi:hypothetical protein
MNATVLVRVRWADSAGCFTAQTMIPLKDRQEASCTYSAEVAAKRAAVGKEWAAFEFAPKGSTTQTELFQAGGAS